MFKLNLLPRTELESITTEEGRKYNVPNTDIWVPSVTTVLGNYYDKSALEAWKKRVGEEKAKLLGEQAAQNGTNLHAVLEKFLLNEDYSNAHSIERMRFESVKRKLIKNINIVYGVEFPLYSLKLNTAGKTDSVVNWNGVNAVLDLKTTKKYKSEKYIENYFVQATTYSMMLNESYNMGIEKIIIMFSTNDFECYYFEKPISDYTELVNRIFNENKNQKN